MFDSMKGLVLLRDGETDDELIVDISLCLSPFKTYPWLQEQNNIVMALGYLEYAENLDPVCALPESHCDDAG